MHTCGRGGLLASLLTSMPYNKCSPQPPENAHPHPHPHPQSERATPAWLALLEDIRIRERWVGCHLWSGPGIRIRSCWRIKWRCDIRSCTMWWRSVGHRHIGRLILEVVDEAINWLSFTLSSLGFFDDFAARLTRLVFGQLLYLFFIHYIAGLLVVFSWHAPWQTSCRTKG